MAFAGRTEGGYLAAAVALMARDRGGPSLCFQLLEIPVTDCSTGYPSMREFGSAARADSYLGLRPAADQGEAPGRFLWQLSR